MTKIARLKLNVRPMLKMITLNAEATPLLLMGTHPIMELRLGAPKSPNPAPDNTRYATKYKYGVEASTVEKKVKTSYLPPIRML